MTTSQSPMEGQAPSSISPQEEQTWASLAHWLGILLSFVGPLIALVLHGEKSARVKGAANESLNFQITLLIGYAIAFVSSFLIIGFILYPILFALQIIFPLLGGLAENKGQAYRYPFALRLIK